MLKFAMTPAALAAMLSCAPAYAFCIQPSAPSCATNFGSFPSEWEFDSCKRDMESYRSEIDTFIQCRQRDVDEVNQQAMELARDAEEAARRAQEAAQNAQQKQSEVQDAVSEARQDVDQVSSDYNNAVNSFNQRAGG